MGPVGVCGIGVYATRRSGGIDFGVLSVVLCQPVLSSPERLPEKKQKYAQ